MSTSSGSPALTASAIVVPVVGSGSHVHRIDGYSGTKGIGKGKYIASETFAAGGHRWCLRYYPDSVDWRYSRSVHVALNLVQADVDKVEANFTISLLDRGGEPVPPYIHQSRYTFSLVPSCRSSSGVDLIDKNELEQYGDLKDDVFSVRCDVTVVAKEIITVVAKAIPVSVAIKQEI